MAPWWIRLLVIVLAGGISTAMFLPRPEPPAREEVSGAAPSVGEDASVALTQAMDLAHGGVDVAEAAPDAPPLQDAGTPAPAPRLVAPPAAPAPGGFPLPSVSPTSCLAQLQLPSTVSPWNPAGPKKVGVQAGHWLTWEVPAELQRLRTSTGTSSGGYTEWEVNLDIARRTVALLAQFGVEAEVLPTTLPPCYRAHAFVSIHADGDVTGALRGFKVARGRGSMIPATDDLLVAALNEQYAAATGLRRDDEHISGRMLNYYAFNFRRQLHAIAPSTPSAIIETAFLTNAADRAFLTQRGDSGSRGELRTASSSFWGWQNACRWDKQFQEANHSVFLLSF